MPSDLPIVSRAIEAAPKDYTVPGAQEIVPIAVTAALDGSGAAGSYVPCLQLLAPDGTVMWTAPTASSVAAGSSCDVSWWARAGTAAVAATTSVTPDWGTYFMGAVVVGSGLHVAGTWNFNAGSPLLAIDGSGIATTVARGVYQLTAWVQSDDVWTASTVAGGRLVVGTPTNYSQRQTGGVTPAGSMKNFAVTLTAEIDAGQEVDVEFENFDTGAHNMYSNQILVQQIYAY